MDARFASRRSGYAQTARRAVSSPDTVRSADFLVRTVPATVCFVAAEDAGGKGNRGSHGEFGSTVIRNVAAPKPGESQPEGQIFAVAAKLKSRLTENGLQTAVRSLAAV